MKTLKLSTRTEVPSPGSMDQNRATQAASDRVKLHLCKQPSSSPQSQKIICLNDKRDIKASVHVAKAPVLSKYGQKVSTATLTVQVSPWVIVTPSAMVQSCSSIELEGFRMGPWSFLHCSILGGLTIVVWVPSWWFWHCGKHGNIAVSDVSVSRAAYSQAKSVGKLAWSAGRTHFCLNSCPP